MDRQKKIYNTILDYWKTIKPYTTNNDLDGLKTALSEFIERNEDDAIYHEFLAALANAYYLYTSDIQDKEFNENNAQAVYGLIIDFWKIIKPYCEPSDSDEYWKSLFDSCVLLERRYKGKPQEKFMIALIGAILDYLEAAWKENKKRSVEL